MISSGCYEGVYQLSGTPQHFISQCIVGGRCMTNSNKILALKLATLTLNFNH